jgi:hypothetical protein
MEAAAEVLVVMEAETLAAMEAVEETLAAMEAVAETLAAMEAVEEKVTEEMKEAELMEVAVVVMVKEKAVGSLMDPVEKAVVMEVVVIPMDQEEKEVVMAVAVEKSDIKLRAQIRAFHMVAVLVAYQWLKYTN